MKDSEYIKASSAHFLPMDDENIPDDGLNKTEYHEQKMKAL